MKGGSHRPTAFGWINLSEDNGETAGQIGGIAIPLIAAATLLIGDIVFISAADTVNKSAVVGNYSAVVGVVVGGETTYMSVLQDDALIGAQQAALVNQRVLVAIQGIAKVVADAAFALGAKVTGSGATAGRATTTGAAAGNYAGLALNAAGAGGAIVRLLVNLA